MTSLILVPAAWKTHQYQHPRRSIQRLVREITEPSPIVQYVPLPTILQAHRLITEVYLALRILAEATLRIMFVMLQEAGEYRDRTGITKREVPDYSYMVNLNFAIICLRSMFLKLQDFRRCFK